MASGAEAPRRASDRWVTPWVVVVLILAGTVVVLAVLGAVTYLTARGFDPEPIVQLTGTLVAAAAATGNFVLSLVKRKTETNTQRQVGRLASGVEGVVEELDARRGRHTYPPGWEDEDPERETAPAAARGRDLDQDASASPDPSRGPSYGSRRYADTLPDDLRDTEWGRA